MLFRRTQDGLARLTHSDVYCSGSLFSATSHWQRLVPFSQSRFASLSLCIVSICSE